MLHGTRLLILTALTLSLLPLTPLAAQDVEGSLVPMERRVVNLDEAGTQVWNYDPGEVDSTILVETLAGTLDPRIEVIDDDGNTVISNDDYAASFSTAAAVYLTGGNSYEIHVYAVYGSGTYQISAVPGKMLLQWVNNFAGTPHADWQGLQSAEISAEGMVLQTENQTLFSPTNAPRPETLYIQFNFSWNDIRPDSRAGLALRSRIEVNNELAGIHFLVDPAGNWSAETSDAVRENAVLQSGSAIITEDTATVGILAFQNEVAFYLNGEWLATEEYPSDIYHTRWGIEIFNSIVTVHEFWLATEYSVPPAYPVQLSNFNTALPDAIAGELIAAGALAEDSARDYIIEPVSHTVTEQGQASFLIGDSTRNSYDNAVIGVEVRLQENNEDAGCGIAARYRDSGNQVVAFVDNQFGVGLVAWRDREVVVNNYVLLDDPPTGSTHLLLVMQDSYVTLYANGELVTQDVIARRTGRVGTAILNYASSNSSCTFRSFWVWQ